MNSKVKYGLIVIALLGIAIVIVLKYVNKPMDDYADMEPKATYSFKEIMDKTSNDTSSLNHLVNELVSVKGVIKKIIKDSASTTVELGDTSSTSSIICQIDSRHQASCSFLKEGQPVCIKGKIAGFELDLDLGLGNTMQMNYCSLEKK
jgi:hypothetical protein